MRSLFEFSLGFFGGAILCVVWDRLVPPGIFKLREVPEHYHWGLVSYLISHPFFYGVGSFLILDERFQDHPFGVGKKHFKLSTLIGIFLVLINIFKYLRGGF